jgi:hypothetical protein
MDAPEQLNETVLPQNVIAPLTRAAIFLVVCIRQDPDAYALLRTFPDLYAPLSSGTLRRVLHASPDSGPIPGTNFLHRHGLRSFTPFKRFAPVAATPSPHRETSCFTFEPSAWTSALNWRPKS